MSQALRAMRVFFLLGGPGSGKTTYAKRLGAEFGVMHISVGQLLRNAVEGPVALRHPRAELIRISMESGEHVDMSIVKDVLCTALRRKRFQCGGGTFLLDGFPMTLDQASMWRSLEGMPEAEGVIHLHCSDDIMIERVLARVRAYTQNRPKQRKRIPDTGPNL
jgi:adenylate kinase family enzyme